LILTSSRPGRRIAGSIRSSRLEAPITMTFFRLSTPSISDSSWGTIVDSMSELMPALLCSGGNLLTRYLLLLFLALLNVLRAA
jgi:hypothetical protein